MQLRSRLLVVIKSYVDMPLAALRTIYQQKFNLFRAETTNATLLQVSPATIAYCEVHEGVAGAVLVAVVPFNA